MKSITNGITDFTVSVEKGNVTVLQITDTQIIDPGQKRSEWRVKAPKIPVTDNELFDKVFSYIQRAVQISKPSLILYTGDIVYGEFDDSGRNFLKIINFMESLGIPWAPIFGNHDNESMKGPTWQCEQLEKADNCLFKRGDITGNGNYTVALEQEGKIIKVIYMADSNGCHNAFTDSYKAVDSNGKPLRYNQGERLKVSAGFGGDQLEWIKGAPLIDKKLGYKVSKFLACHIPPYEYVKGAYKAGYLPVCDARNECKYIIGETVPAKNGDFGKRDELDEVFECDGLWQALKQGGFDGVFAGHAHKINTSVLYDGIRLTYGLKTGVYDYHNSDMLGATKIVLNGQDFKVSHIYID